MYLTGSRALNYHLGLPQIGSSSDWDIISTEKELNNIGLSFNGRNSIRQGDIEFLSSEALNNYRLISGTETTYKYENEFVIPLTVCTLGELYAQKRSHVWRPLKFARHIQQLQLIKNEMNKRGLGLTSLDLSILTERIVLTKAKYKDRVPSLNKSNEEFFHDNVTKYYIHDDLHMVMRHYAEGSLYERLKLDKSSAKCEKDLWDHLSHSDKIKCVQEECYVIAVERFIIPKLERSENHMPPKFAFMKALEKVCTTLTSGWFRDFAIDYWDHIKNYQVDFLGKLLYNIETGRLKKCQK